MERLSDMTNIDFKHRLTNTDRIAQLRRIDSAAAVDFWKQVSVPR